MRARDLNKGQSAAEFLIVIGAVFFFVVSFLLVINGNISGRVVESYNLAVKDVAFTVVDELNLAINSVDGYSRNFTLPEKIINQEYDVSIDGGLVYVRTLDGEYAISLPVGESVIGQPFKGENSVRRANGLVYLNS